MTTKTTEDQILHTLNSIRRTFYADTPHLFYRDQRHILKAITRYAWETNTRGWYFSADFIFNEINHLLRRIRETKADFDFLPAYLEQAISRHVNYHAEELSAEAKAINNVTGRVVKQLPTGLPDERELKRQRVTETLAGLFQVLRQPKPKPDYKQPRLL